MMDERAAIRTQLSKLRKNTKTLGRSTAPQYFITTEIRDMMNGSTRYDFDEEEATSTAAEMLVDSVQPVVL